MIQRIIILQSNNTDPFIHLAAEEFLFSRLQKGDYVLFLYQNSPSVVIGRHQNPWLETDPLWLSENKIHLVRRISGGGAVFHDFGNLNLCFLAHREDYDPVFHYSILQNALISFQVRTHLSEKVDLVVSDPLEGEKKVSGNAFFYRGEKKMHHATLLIHVDRELLHQSLQAKVDALNTHATRSRRRSIINLVELNPSITVEIIQREILLVFERSLPDIPMVRYEGTSFESLIHHPDLIQRRKELQTFYWIYGKTPRFEWENRMIDPSQWASEEDIPPELSHGTKHDDSI